MSTRPDPPGPAVPLVSVVTVFLDEVRYLDEAVRSVLAQTHPRVELVLVDDGSTDGSSELARRHAAAHPDRVRVLEHPGHVTRGQSASRNLGLQAARGELLAFLDGDDVWAPEHLAHDVALLAAHPEAGMVCGRYVEWRSWADPAAADTPAPLPHAPGTVVAPPGLLTAVLRRGAFSTGTGNLLVRTELLRAAGGVDEQVPLLYEDQALMAVLYATTTAVVSGATHCLYRQRPDSVSARARRRRRDSGRAREGWLRWLVAHPALAGPHGAEVRALAGAELAALERRRARPLPVRAAGRLTALARPTVARVVGSGHPALLRFGSFRRTRPVDRLGGSSRGTPVDRWYVERFLAEHADSVRGRVLEAGDDGCTRRYGGDRVTSAEVVNAEPGVPGTTWVADLADGGGLPTGAFDCVLLTQVLPLVYDLPAAVRTLHRVLAPGGALLLTVPGISHVPAGRPAGTWHWSVHPPAARRLFGEVFGDDHVEVAAAGNVLSSVAFLEGLAAEELREEELAVRDPQYPLVVTVRAWRRRE